MTTFLIYVLLGLGALVAGVALMALALVVALLLLCRDEPDKKDADYDKHYWRP